MQNNQENKDGRVFSVPSAARPTAVLFPTSAHSLDPQLGAWPRDSRWSCDSLGSGRSIATTFWAGQEPASQVSLLESDIKKYEPLTYPRGGVFPTFSP